MEVTKNDLVEVMNQIGRKIDDFKTQIAEQNQIITNLKSQNEQLQQNQRKTLSQIKEYTEELEKIRSHYVDSSNNISW